MKNWFLAGALTLTPLAAHAGPGSSVNLGGEYVSSSAGSGFLGNGWFWGGGFWPSFDWRADPLILQFHVLEFLAALSEEDVFLGANILLDLIEGSALPGTRGVIQPGATVDIFSGNDFAIALGGTARLGLEGGGDVSMGVYVVPVLGVVINDGDLGLLTGGGLEFSVWFGGSGGGGSSSSYGSGISSSGSDDIEDF